MAAVTTLDQLRDTCLGQAAAQRADGLRYMPRQLEQTSMGHTTLFPKTDSLLDVRTFFVTLLTQVPRVTRRDFYPYGKVIGQMLAQPAPQDFPELSPSARARLGVLASLCFDPPAHSSWLALASRHTGEPIAFWADDDLITPLDELGLYWGFDRGADATMVQRALRGDTL